MDRSDAPAAGPSPGGPLRVGILVDSLVQPRWRGRVVAEIASSPIAQLALVVELRPNRRRRPNRLRRLISEWRHLLYHLYRALDDRLFRGGPDALDETDISGLTTPVQQSRSGRSKAEGRYHSLIQKLKR